MNRVLWLDHKDPVLMACHVWIHAVFDALFRLSPTLLPHPPSPFLFAQTEGVCTLPPAFSRRMKYLTEPTIVPLNNHEFNYID